MTKKKKKKNKPKKDDGKLKPSEELFCRLYAGAGEYFNNAVRAYGVAYNKPLPVEPLSAWNKTQQAIYNYAGVESHGLLKKPKIRKRCDEILMEEFKDDIADKELAFVLKQRKDLSAKINAIREYNKLKQRIIDISVDLKTIPLGKQTNAKIDNIYGGNKTRKNKTVKGTKPRRKTTSTKD